MKTIPLTKGYFAIVDDEDYDMLVRDYKWCISHSGKSDRKKAVARVHGGKGTLCSMHRVVANAPKGMDVDHINRNTLDNRRSNLRVCTRSQNNANRPKRSGEFKGVHFDKAKSYWVAQAASRYIGRFSSAVDAAVAYDLAAIKHFGEFALTNFPRENYE